MPPLRQRLMIPLLSVAILRSLLPSGGLNAEQPGTQSEGAVLSISKRFQRLSRQTSWDLVSQKELPFATHHPQGMTKWGELYFLSTVEVTEFPRRIESESRSGRAPGRGVGHLIAFDSDGEKKGEMQLGDDQLYHPGGIDSDDQFIWVPVAEYRPDSRSVIYRVCPSSMVATEVQRVDDHVGAVIRDTQQNRLIGFSWGSRRIYSWSLDAKYESVIHPGSVSPEPITNPQFYIDYQDGQYVGDGLALVSGLSGYRIPGGGRFSLGGIDLIDLATMRPVHQLPVELYTDRTPHRVLTQNPMYVEKNLVGLRFHFIPEDNRSRWYIFDTKEQSLAP